MVMFVTVQPVYSIIEARQRGNSQSETGRNNYSKSREKISTYNIVVKRPVEMKETQNEIQRRNRDVDSILILGAL